MNCIYGASFKYSILMLSISAEITDAELVRIELQDVLTVFKKKPNWEFLRTPLVYITSKSSPKDVQQWLQQKAFTERYCS